MQARCLLFEFQRRRYRAEDPSVGRNDFLGRLLDRQGCGLGFPARRVPRTPAERRHGVGKSGKERTRRLLGATCVVARDFRLSVLAIDGFHRAKDLPVEGRAPALFSGEQRLLEGFERAKKVAAGMRRCSVDDTDQMEQIVERSLDALRPGPFDALSRESHRVSKAPVEIGDPPGLESVKRRLDGQSQSIRQKVSACPQAVGQVFAGFDGPSQRDSARLELGLRVADRPREHGGHQGRPPGRSRLPTVDEELREGRQDGDRSRGVVRIEEDAKPAKVVVERTKQMAALA